MNPAENQCVGTGVSVGANLPSTHWSRIAAASNDLNGESTEAQAALEFICRRYWPAVVACARQIGLAPSDAEDVTQGFFHRFIERQYIRAADPDRGRFRSFLLTSFRHFCATERTRQLAQKRGGAVLHLEWNEVTEPQRCQGIPGGGKTDPPERAFDREWAQVVMRQSLDRLREEWIAADRERIYEALKGFLAMNPQVGEYETVGNSVRQSPGAVAVHVHRMRTRFREIFRSEVATTVLQPGDVDDEVRYLVSLICE